MEKNLFHAVPVDPNEPEFSKSLGISKDRAGHLFDRIKDHIREEALKIIEHNGDTCTYSKTYSFITEQCTNVQEVVYVMHLYHKIMQDMASKASQLEKMMNIVKGDQE